MKRLFQRGQILVLLLILAGCSAQGAEEPEHGAVAQIETEQVQEPQVAAIPPDAVGGVVLDTAGNPVENAVVRLQTSTLYTTTNAEGEFLLEGIQETEPFRLTAFAPGYFIKEADTSASASDVVFTLVAHAAEDNPDYQFLSAGFTTEGDGENTGCAECHSATSEEAAQGITLPFDEWRLDAHAQAAINPRFLSMYNGTDLDGNASPPTTYITHRDYGSVPLPPTVDETYFGPGFLLDFPENPGNCATCHLPIMAINDPYGSNVNHAAGVELEGISCDYCHKVWDVKLDVTSGATIGVPFSNMPGVISFESRRPSEGHQFFAGPFDDVAPGEDTFSPLQNKSEYCAPCHMGDFWNTRVYNSFGEWIESPYADSGSETFRTCQDCHMPPVGMDHFARYEKGGLTRDPETIFSHRMPGAADETLLQNTAELSVEAVQEDGQVIVDVAVFNAKAGHHIPTDSPLRQIFLLVKVTGEGRETLPLVEGQVLPNWAGDLADVPGFYFAKILEQLWTEISPTGAYWTQTRLIEDTRLPALEIKEGRFIFEASEGSPVTVEVSLIFRRAFYDIMQQKGWDTPDLFMEKAVIELP